MIPYLSKKRLKTKEMVKNKFLQLDENYRVYPDPECWILKRAQRDGKGRVISWGGNLYYASLEQIFNKYMDLLLKEAWPDLEKIRKEIKKVSALIEFVDTKLRKEVFELYKLRYKEKE